MWNHALSNFFDIAVLQSTSNRTFQWKLDEKIQPIVRLHPPRWSETKEGKNVSLVCTVDASQSVKVKWYKNGTEQHASEKRVQENNKFIIISWLETNADSWISGTEYKCEVSYGTNKSELKTSVCSAYPFITPPISVKTPRLQSSMNDDEKLTAQCEVAALYPFDVDWISKELSAHKPNQQLKEKYIVDSGKSTQSIIGNLTLTKKDWASLKTITCQVQHPCLTLNKTINLKGSQMLNRTVEIRRSLPHPGRKNNMQLECVATGFSPGEIYVTFQANGKDIANGQSIDLSSETAVHSTVTRFNVPKEQWNKECSFTCTVRQGYDSGLVSKPTGKIFGKPSVELLILPDLEAAPNITKLVCLASGFNPQIKWNFKSSELAATASKTVMAENGLVTVASEMILPEDWNQWKQSLTCVVHDNSNIIRKNINKCAVTPPAFWMAQLSLRGPILIGSGLKASVSVMCIAVVYKVNNFTLSWMVDEYVQSRQMLQGEHGIDTDGMQTFRSQLNVTMQDWLAYKRITCQVKHPCSSEAQEKHITRGKDMQRPTVQIINLLDSGHPNSTNSSLLCLISNFFPDIISVHWELSGTKLAPSMYFSSTVAQQANGTYFMYSMLLVPPSELQQDLYGCVVRHEFSEQPITATFQKKLQETAPVLPPSPPTATLLHSSNELVCLVQGFNPAPINITWFMNHVTELLEHNITGPSQGTDGTFIVTSRLHTSISNSVPGTVYTCAVTHSTTRLLVNISKQEIIEQDIYFDGTNYHDMLEETFEEIWKATYIFLALFLISLIYGSIITFMKVQ